MGNLRRAATRARGAKPLSVKVFPSRPTFSDFQEVSSRAKRYKVLCSGLNNTVESLLNSFEQLARGVQISVFLDA